MTTYAAPTSVTAVSTTDPVSGLPEITVTVVCPAGGTPTCVVSRGDGYYLIGASPGNGPTALVGGSTFIFTDTTAPYGLPSSYGAVLVYGGNASAVVGSSAIMGNSPNTNRLWGYLPEFAKSNDGAVGYQFLRFLAGMCDQQQVIDSLVRDQGGAPGWSQAMDINRCPTFALPWLAQFVGVRLDSTLRDDQMRYAIQNAGGFQRGTPGAVLAAANQYLIAGYTATLTERDTSPYHLAIGVPTAGVAGSATCQSLYLNYSACSALYAGSGGTGTFTACSQLWNTNGLISAAVIAAIPAGLVAVVTYF